MRLSSDQSLDVCKCEQIIILHCSSDGTLFIVHSLLADLHACKCGMHLHTLS